VPVGVGGEGGGGGVGVLGFKGGKGGVEYFLNSQKKGKSGVGLGHHLKKGRGP